MSNTKKLDPDFKAKWVAALRSGEYKQGKYNLWTPETDSFCCIGVSGVLRGLSKEQMKRQQNYGQDIYQSACPLDVTILADLAEKNDSGEYTFAHIADYIEENL